MRRRIALGVGAAALAALGLLLATQGNDDPPDPRRPAARGTSTRATGTSGTTSGPPPATTTNGTNGTTTSAGTTPGTSPGDGSRPFEVGVWEYFVRDPSAATARRRIGDAEKSGFDAVITNAFWAPGQLRPPANEATELRNAARAARAAGIRPMVIVANFGSRTTPRTPELRKQFAAYATWLARNIPEFRDFVIGNEPNLNRFWLPQFGPNGENVAARDYLSLLAATYDALKEVSAEIRIIGGALAPRGGDDPSALRKTHSPTKFIRDLGRFYRESGRDEPVMDAFAHHPYLERSRVPPSSAHPRSTTISLADYDKLVKLLAEAFDGTAQRGSDLPILYTEFGVQTRIPAAKRPVYTNHGSPIAADAVSEATQEAFYREAVEIACKQATVEGIYIFHIWDEPDLLGWQSGLYYADRTPKTSQDAFADLRSCR